MEHEITEYVDEFQIPIIADQYRSVLIIFGH